ncbi:hypothetical protein HU200_067480 [Digitaria exilis]|uniref:Uncharacterized protein n=1 Tax=Digitaria exilis TaxID=1010633 RepID=A0A835DT97_9POAL|nr:hypothetical protein HU200_067480 [Digitaria exilis]
MILVAKEFALSPPAAVAPRRRASPPAGGGSPVPDLWLRTAAPAAVGTHHSHDSDMDLAMLVTDFLESGASAGGDSRASSDSDSGLPDLAHLVDNISMLKQGGDDTQNELLSMVHSLLLSIHDSDLQAFKRRDHEYIDVIMHRDTTGPERLMVDIDFRSHFEIARAVDSYGTLLTSLPVVYVGTLPRLKQFLHVMVDAAKWSLKQNSMPLPPWRSLPYLQAKWQSKYERTGLITELGFHGTASDHVLCIGHLKRLKTSLQTELETGRLLMMPIKADKTMTPKFERRRRRSLLSC